MPAPARFSSQPDTGDARPRPRVSLPMAFSVWEDEVLEVLPGLGKPRYRPIRAETFDACIASKYYGDNYAGQA